MLRIISDNGVLRRNRGEPSHREVWQLWHVWTVTIPRRAINGELVWGTVLRRHDGDRWIYKKYIDAAKRRY